MIPCANPGLCKVSSHFEGTEAKCQTQGAPSALHGLLTTPPVAPTLSTNPFSLDEINKSSYGDIYRTALSRLSALQGGGVIRRFKDRKRIGEAMTNLATAEKNLKEMIQLNADNNDWHKRNPNVPHWIHAGTASATNTKKSTYDLYRLMRNFPTIAGRGVNQAPGLATASERMHANQLSESDGDILREYFRRDDSYAKRSHDSEYWKMQVKIDSVIRKIKKLDEPITIWRGERFSSGGFNSEWQFDRLRHLTSLQPGEVVEWNNCVATSAALFTASEGNFGGSVNSNGGGLPTHIYDPEIDSNEFDGYSILFEMETDRGVFLDKNFPSDSPVDESEVLLPMNMKYEVIGHVQMRAKDLNNGTNSDRAYHVIKLKLAS